MTRQRVQKLSLHRETLVRLSNRELQRIVVAGDEDQKNTYPISRCGYTCICID